MPHESYPQFDHKTNRGHQNALVDVTSDKQFLTKENKKEKRLDTNQIYLIPLVVSNEQSQNPTTSGYKHSHDESSGVPSYRNQDPS